MSEIVDLIPAAFMAAYGTRLLLRTREQLSEAQAAHQRRIDDRMVRGHDAYADELRSLKTYLPITSIIQRRLFGFLLLALCLGLIVLILFVSE